VRARKYATPPPRRNEVGVLGRPYPGERVSGDHAGWVWTEEALVVGVADGLGHGPEARLAADLAVEALSAHAHLSPEALLARCDTQLRGTRGAALGVVRWERRGGRLEHACLGNITTLLCRPGQVEPLPCTPGALGLPSRTPRASPYTSQLLPGGLLVLHTDGLSTRTTVEDLVLLRRHPLVVAHALLRRYGKEHDDALVLVARSG
jgi:hypothetical protein